MKKLLITGSSGFIGRACLEHLKDKYEIYAVSLDNEINKDINCSKLNILSQSEVDNAIKKIKPNLLLHLAWETGHGSYMNDYSNIDWASATFNLAKSFYENGGEKAVFAGTCFEYDLSYGVLREQFTPLNPNSIYGLSKKYAFDLINEYTSKNNLNMAWCRIFYAYGMHENINRLVPYVINKLIAKEKAICSSGEQIRDYMFVEDIARAFGIVLDSDFNGEINISSNSTTKIKDVVLEIENCFKLKDLVQLDPSLDRKLEPKIIIGDNERLMSLGWEQKYDLKSGISKYVSQYIEMQKGL